jgi:deazaflavin-dependent oxidoreductase (nitroreductase family)
MQTSLQEQKRASSILSAFFKLILTLTFLEVAGILISIALEKAMQKSGLRNSIRRFNKRTLNPLTLKVAGNRLGIYASLEHVGRRSGRVYSTPVAARPLGDGFVIALQYGTDTDWYRNVMAAGTCTLRWHGQKYILERPEILQPSAALRAYPWSPRFILAMAGTKQYVWLHQRIEIPEKVFTGV